MEHEYYIVSGGHRDVRRIYPIMEFDFEEAELFPEWLIHTGLIRNALEVLLLKREDGMECGYAVMQTRSNYGYVLIGYISVYPTMRGNALGDVFLDLIKKRYAYSKGILLEVTCPEGKDYKREKLCAFYARNGWEPIDRKYELCGIPATIMCLPVRSKADITPAARCILQDLYTRLYPRCIVERTINVE